MIYVRTYTIFTWLNALVIIEYLCKMIVTTIQGRLLFNSIVYCNIIMITAASIQKPYSLTVKIILLLYGTAQRQLDARTQVGG